MNRHAGCLKRQKRSFLLLGKRNDMEAVAAMQIFEAAMSEVSQQLQESIEIFNCSMLPEAQVLMFTQQGTPIIIMLSEGVLTCPLVQRVCALRSSQLVEQGIGTSS